MPLSKETSLTSGSRAGAASAATASSLRAGGSSSAAAAPCEVSALDLASRAASMCGAAASASFPTRMAAGTGAVPSGETTAGTCKDDGPMAVGARAGAIFRAGTRDADSGPERFNCVPADRPGARLGRMESAPSTGMGEAGVRRTAEAAATAAARALAAAARRMKGEMKRKRRDMISLRGNSSDDYFREKAGARAWAFHAGWKKQKA